MDIALMHFKEWTTPAGVRASALFQEGLTTGIYILEFANGEEYVGKTVNFPRRFTDHRRRWPDIVAVRFAPVLVEDLDQMERAVVAERQSRGAVLRNLLLISQPLGPSRLDMVIDKQAQAEWLTADADYDGLTMHPQRSELARRRMRSRRKLDQLMRHPGADEVISAVAAYVAAAIPSPDLGEGTLWTLTAMPSTARSAVNHRLATLSIQNVEVLFLGERKNDAGEWVPYSVLTVGVQGELPGEILDFLEENQRYRSAGPVRSIEVAGFHPVPQLLEMPEVLYAARSLALGQMRKGRAVFSRFHNDAFADAVFSSMGG